MRFERKRVIKFDSVYKCEIHIRTIPGITERFITIQNRRRRLVQFIAVSLTAYLNLLKATAKFKEII
jgi:hypothetical protein